MTKNVGANDAHVRIIVAAVLVIAALLIVKNEYLRIILALFGAVLAATAYLRTCGLYTLMGKNTCEPEIAPVPEQHDEVSPATSEEKPL